jgi:cell division protein FtsI (penicillin-binding protein 3)
MSAPAPARAGVVGVLCLAGFMVVLGAVTTRIIQLQTYPSPQLARFIDDRTSSWEVEPIRGDLRDRRGRVVSTSRFQYRLAIDPATFPEEPEDRDRAIVRLAETTGIPPADIGMKLITALGENDIRRRALEEWNAPPEGTAAHDSLQSRLLRALGVDADDQAPAALSDWAQQVGGPKPLIRYLPFEPLVDQTTANAVRILRLPGVSFDRVAVRDYPGGDVAAGLIGKVGYGDVGLLGAEVAFDGSLTGESGRVRYVRDHRGRPLWVGRGDWKSPVRGDDIRLSIDLALQTIATEELARGIDEAGAAGGRLVMLDPQTGEILAMVDRIVEDIDAEPFPYVKLEGRDPSEPAPEVGRDHNDWPRYRVIRPDPARDIHPALGRNRCIEDIYEPGSTFKPFVWAHAYEIGLLPDTETIHIADARNYRTPYGRHLADVTRRSDLTWPEVLLYSSNIGMSQVADRLDHKDLRNLVHRLGFGSPTGLKLPGEASGLVTGPRDWTKYTQTSVAIGYEIGVTPVQMVRAFSAFARNGDLAGTVPEIRLTAQNADDPTAGVVERIYEPDTALRVRAVIEGVAQRMDANRERVKEDSVPATYRMFGKSGTAKIAVSPPPGFGLPRYGRGYFEKQYNSSFIAAAPFEEPRIIVLVIIDDPKPELVRLGQAYGSWVAGPVVRRVIERSLRYLGVDPDMPAAEVAKR